MCGAAIEYSIESTIQEELSLSDAMRSMVRFLYARGTGVPVPLALGGSLAAYGTVPHLSQAVSPHGAA